MNTIQNIELQFTEVNGSPSEGFVWKELYEVKTDGFSPVFMKVVRTSRASDCSRVCITIFADDDTELLRLTGDGLNGTILEQAKSFLSDRIKLIQTS